MTSYSSMTMRRITNPLSIHPRENFKPSMKTGEASEPRELHKHSIEDKPIAEEAYCSICMESIPLPECFAMEGCSHLFCKSCVAQFVAAKLEENVSSIQCPDITCKEGVVEPEACRMILPKDVYERWGRVLCESSIPESRKLYCPYKDCLAMVIDEWGLNGELVMEAECPHCRKTFSVPIVRKLRDDPMIREMAANNKWQKCPACGVYVEKIDGCLYISCRCGYGFCYGCASPLVEHYCEKCQGKL